MASMAVVVPTSVADTPVGEDWTQAQIDARYTLFRQRINELMGAGKTQPEIDSIIAQEFDIVRIGLPALQTPADGEVGFGGGTMAKSAADDADGTASDAGLQMADTDLAIDTASSATTASEVKIYTPTFSYDNLLHKYVMAASWDWKICTQYKRACWADEKTSAGPVGGPDGMGVKLNRLINRYNVGISTSDNCGNPKINNDQADTDSGYGIGFIEQDTVSLPGGAGMCAGTPYRYNWHRGTVSETFLFRSNCAGIQLQIDSKIGHSWSTTSVTSMGISTSGIAFGWSKTASHWNAMPASPAHDYC
jgi:hypothetical protein